MDSVDFTFTDLKSMLFDSPCAWRDADSDSSDSGLGSPNSLPEIPSPDSLVRPRGISARRDLFSSKRQRDTDDSDVDSPLKRQRHHQNSTSADETKCAVAKLQSTEDNLVGDGSRIHSLPTIETRNHRDLRTVTPSTVQRLLQGEFDDVISDFQDHRLQIPIRV